MKFKLNIGSGRNYIKGYINIDNSKKIKVDIYADALNLPFKENSIDLIYASHLIEDFLYPEQAIKHWYDLLKTNGILEIIVPYAFSHYAFVNPNHLHYFSWKALDFLLNSEESNYDLNYKFRIVRKEFRLWENSKDPPRLRNSQQITPYSTKGF
jgi:ubiquinone/menaquinone biosynthesis C-methylase UbiE